MNAPARTGPSIARGKSNQAYETPPELLEAIKRRFGKLAWDLAATEENAKAPNYFTPEEDSLKEDWSTLVGTAYLNPPFGSMVPWARKCASVRDRTGWTLLLCPSSTGAGWFQEHIVPHGFVLELAPRICFNGKQPFPKDCLLTAFGFGIVGRGFWRWR